MRKILHVVNITFTLPYFFGNQFLYFGDKGYKFFLICSPSQSLIDYGKQMNIETKGVEITRAISPLTDLKSLRSLYKYIKDHKIEVVIGHSPKGALLSMLASWLARTPRRIYFRHGLVYETMSGFKRNVMMAMERLTAYCATEIVCVSPSIYNQSILHKLNREEKQIVLGKGTCGGIDAINKFNPECIVDEELIKLREKLNLKDDCFVIGYSGRLVRDKGIVELVEAFELLINRKNVVDPYLLIVGDFEERDSLPTHIADKIKSNPRIIFTGFIFSKIEYYYALMDVFILPSYREGFGMVILEASAMEVPVLTTKATGCIDAIVEGETGFYVPISASGICDGLSNIYMNVNRGEIGKNGRKRVLQYFDNSILWPIIEDKLYK